MTGWVIRIYENNSAGAAAQSAFDGVEVDVPAVIIKEAVVPDLNRLQPGQVFEKRIGGPRNQHFAAGITEKFEDPGVSLARAGGEDHVVVRRAIFAGDAFARGRHAEGRRFIKKRAFAGESIEKSGGILDARLSRIRGRQVENALAAAALLLQQNREGVGPEFARKPGRQLHGRQKSPDAIRAFSGGCEQ